MLIYVRLCETMKSIWINEVRENQDKTGYTISAPEIPTMKSLDDVNKKNDVSITASEAPEKM